MLVTRGRPGRQVTLVELGLGAALLGVVVPLVAGGTYAAARADKVTYTEFWSGLEKKAWQETVTCVRDGSCEHTYACDPYTVMVTRYRQVPYTTTETTTVNGKLSTRTVTRYRSEAYQVPETRWHACPFVTEEHTFKVSDTLGDTHVFGDSWFPQDAPRWSGDGYLEGRGGGRPGLPNVARGVPAEWAKVKARLDAGEPGGVTKPMPYRNYVLASTETVLKRASDAVADYRRQGLLPDPVKGITGHYDAQKVYFVGDAAKTPDRQAWQDAAARFNGHFGADRQGDLHLVVVDAAQVRAADRYASAVAARWQSPALGRHAIGKNALVVVLALAPVTPGGASVTDGTQGAAIAWARAFTGMPVGNERVVVDVREQLPGTPFTSEALLGPAKAPTTGLLGLLTLADKGGFKRVEMEDFAYLYASIEPSATVKGWIVAGAGLLGVVVWVLFIVHDVPSPFGSRSPRAPGSGGVSSSRFAEQVLRTRRGPGVARRDSVKGREWL